ncbi:DNA polymerase zeta catalytic subunit [Blumeria hordei DH14]|uniref:DNA polymerase n=1 Tax=Blumeria graminis f. sp. hordei (strain DH14) TaxID=546991 RepID=N1JN65_BLUG1|nr:DNA polymerase zeta catalytic subunit [Blumeria hordei DH14]
MDTFRVKLDHIDFYRAQPSKLDPFLRCNVSPSQLHNEPKVPIIRIFGATETGQKVCAHVHGAFPYLFVEYGGSLKPNDVGTYIQKLHLGIDHSLAASYRHNGNNHNSRFVARITLVKGIPFYGFHVGYKYFLKIHMLDPLVMTRLSDILRQGTIMKRIFQLYEAHIPYLLQWMIDYNLYGCSYINCSRVLFRAPVPQFENLNHIPHLWHDLSIPPDLIIKGETFPRISYCSLEVDICVQDILNRHEIKPRNLHHDFVERLNPFKPNERLVNSMAALWKDETRRRRAQMSDPGLTSSPFPPEVLISMSAGARYSQPGGWIHEEEYKRKIKLLILQEKNDCDGVEVTFKNFVKPESHETSVKSVLEAVEDLYPHNIRPALGLTPIRKGGFGLENITDAKQDEKKLNNLAKLKNVGHSYDFDKEVLAEGLSSQDEAETVLDGDPLKLLSPCNLSYMGDSPKPTPDIFNKDLINGGVGTTNISTNKSKSLSYTDEVGIQGGRSKTGHLNSFKEKQSTLTAELKLESKIRTKRLSGTKFSSDHVTKRHRILPRMEYCKVFSEREPSDRLNPEPPRGSVKSPSIFIKTDLTSSPSLMGIVNSRKPLSRTISTRQRNFFSRNVVGSQETILSFPVVKDPYHSSPNLWQSQRSNLQSCLDGKEKTSFLLPRLPVLSPQASTNRYPSSSLFAPKSESQSKIISLVLNSMRRKFPQCSTRNLLAFHKLSPSTSELISTLPDFKLPSFIYQDPFYSNESDIPERARDYAGKEFKLEGLSIPFLPDFDATCNAKEINQRGAVDFDWSKIEYSYHKRRQNCRLRSWHIINPPPSYQEVLDWAQNEKATSICLKIQSSSTAKKYIAAQERYPHSQIEGPTQRHKHGFKYSHNQEATSVIQESQHMSLFSLEIHVNTRENLSPDPEKDEIQCLFWCLQLGDLQHEDGMSSKDLQLGVITLSDDGLLAKKIQKSVTAEVCQESSELDLIIRIVEIVRRFDPDILTGYELHGSSWGYLIQRAYIKYEYNLCDELSRIKPVSYHAFEKDKDQWGLLVSSAIHITGRHMINIWRAMRNELNLLQYTLENVTFHLLNRRTPHYTWSDLTKWFSSGKTRDLARVMNYYLSRVRLNLEILQRNELIERTSEQARLLGVDFASIISRGSQYKVESLMFRIAKAENFILISPSRKQVGGQNALECLPLVMEPQSAFYTNPVLVLDFQSLYPSVIIAYNYCYSTFLGRIVNWRGRNKMGFTDYNRQQRLVELLQEHINISPNGIMYVKPEIRKSLLAKMLGEILETRVMVKSGMKADKDDKALQRLLNNRQLALKLIANVTYGYTSASFSGRMPCAEIADSIVQTGRETLEKAIALIHSVKRWGAEVVYGDTDSLFICLKGRTKDQAFDIGEEITKCITDMNPKPIKLKFEKVYLPCVLIAKKRYVGFKYEDRNQVEPEFDAKGIETVRRDGTPAEQKIQEKALKILFRTSDLSQVKNYFVNQCAKIMSGSVSIQDFCFAKEVRMGTYSKKGIPPPGAFISAKRMLSDARDEPQHGERVPYVVIAGAPGARLIDRCVAPEELLGNEEKELDSEYYISKNIIPPLERIFNLVGANVRGWYDEMPKIQRIRRVDIKGGKFSDAPPNRRILEAYMKSSSCLVCRERLKTEGPICLNCMSDRPKSILALQQRLNATTRKLLDIQKICQSCSEISPLEEVRCDSKDCPVFYTRIRQGTLLKNEQRLIEPMIGKLANERITLRDLEW